MFDDAFLAQVIDELPHAMFVKDRQFRYVLVNRALLQMTEFPAARILGQTDYSFFPDSIADAYRAQDVEVFATGKELTVEEEVFRHPNGERRVIATRKVALRNAAQEITHLIGIISDITRRKAVEEELRSGSEQLERRVVERTRALETAQADLVRKERLAVLGQLAGGVAHQIRNPLGAIKNAAYILAKPDAKEAAAHAHAIAIIHDEVHRANQIITDLLDYARVRVPVRSSTPINCVIEQALGAEVIPPSIKIERRAHDLPNIAIDPGQVQEALFNIFRNAVEAMPNGGTITIDAEVREDVVVIRIGDSGPGISPEIAGRLFEPLITTKPLGLGLGLVTARTLIEGQGGTVVCANSTDRGACFEVTLPRAIGG